jgi:hypothetical protein
MIVALPIESNIPREKNIITKEKTVMTIDRFRLFEKSLTPVMPMPVIRIIPAVENNASWISLFGNNHLLEFHRPAYTHIKRNMLKTNTLKILVKESPAMIAIKQVIRITNTMKIICIVTLLLNISLAMTCGLFIY